MRIAEVLTLERKDGAPLYRQLYGAVKAAILRGAFTPGMQLPPTRELCAALGVSRQTVLNAYEQLLAEGYLAGQVGKGTFISADLPAAVRKTPQAKGLLRPLSARGQLHAQAMGMAAHHVGKLRAFRVGMPGIDLFPFDVWNRIEARHWRRPDHHMGYGDPAGYAPLRELLCVYLRAARGVLCEPAQIIITSGSQQALYLLSTLLLAPGEQAWVESPGYRGASAPLQAGGAQLCPVPLDEQGLRVGFGAQRFPDAKLVYVTPSRQLPLGVTMSLQRRLELLQWAASNKAWVLEDDYDSEYRYTGPPLASLQGLDRAGSVVYVGTLSKVLFPGLRLGYVVAPPALVDPLINAKAVMDRHTAIVPQQTLADFIAGGHFGRHIKRTREAYAERRQVLMQGIERQLGEHLRIGAADAGMDLCVHFRRRQSENALVKAGMEQGLELRGLGHYVDHHADQECATEPGLLLGFSAHKPAEIKQGLALLAKLYSRV